MSAEVEDVPLHFACIDRPVKIPAWTRGWHVDGTTIEQIFSSTRSGVAVIQSRNLLELQLALNKMKHSGRLERFARSLSALHVVVQFASTQRAEVAAVAQVLRLFHGSPGKVDFVWGQGHLRDSVIEAAAKLLVEQESQKPTNPDPLAEVKEVIEATRFLLAPSGRLSAPAVAEAFDISTAKLGDIIGRSRQALAKTPDAPAIQSALRPFERIARLRAVLSKTNFRAWLHRPNRQLGEATPLTLIKDGRVGIVADLAEDMLMGTPG